MDSNTVTIERLSISKAIETGWTGLKKNLFMLIGLSLLAWLITAAPHLLNRLFISMLGSDNFLLWVISPVLSLLSFGLSLLVVMGLLKIALKVCDDQNLLPEDLFNCYPMLLNYLLATLIVGLIVIVGLFLFIVPGIIWSIQFSQYRYLIVDKQVGPIESLQQSSALTKGARWNLFGLFLLLFGINIVGALFLGLGLLVTIPLSFVATAAAYRQLLSTSNLAPATT